MHHHQLIIHHSQWTIHSILYNRHPSPLLFSSLDTDRMTLLPLEPFPAPPIQAIGPDGLEYPPR